MIIKMNPDEAKKLVKKLISLTENGSLVWKENTGSVGPGCDWPDTTYMTEKSGTKFRLDHTTGELTIKVRDDENITEVSAIKLRRVVETQIHPKLLSQQERWRRYDLERERTTINRILDSVS